MDPAGIDFGIGLGQRFPVVEATRVPFGDDRQALSGPSYFVFVISGFNWRLSLDLFRGWNFGLFWFGWFGFRCCWQRFLLFRAKAGHKTFRHGFSGFHEIFRDTDFLAHLDLIGIHARIDLGQHLPIFKAARVPPGNDG